MRRVPAVVAIVLLTTLGACGGSDGSSGSGSGGSDGAAPGSDKAVKVLDPCTLLTPEQVGPVLGGAATVKEAPGGGCSFAQEDPRDASVGFFATPGASGGGYESTKAGLVNDGTIEDVAGVGDGAWLAVGKVGGDSLQGQGVVAVGDTIVNISLSPASGADKARVTSMMESLISLVGTIG